MTRTAALVLLAAGAAACASRGTVPPPGAPLTPTLAPLATGRPTSDGPAVSLTLAGALARAEAGHPALQAADSDVQASRAAEAGAGLLPEPTLEARAEGVPLGGSGDGKPDALLGVSQPIPLGGRLSAEARVARLERERAERARDVARARVRSSVRGAFAAALHAEEVVRALDESERILEEAVRISRARLAAGDATRDEPARAEMELARRRLETAGARSHRERARTALAATVGVPGLRVGAVEGALDEALSLPAVEDLARRLAGSPNAAALRAEVEAARARADLAESERIPDLRADLFYRRTGEPRGNALDAGVAFEIPLFGRARSKAAVARAEAESVEARARLAMTEEEAALRDALARLEAALASRGILESEVLPRAEEVTALAVARHRAGDMGLAELLAIQDAAIEVRLERLDTLREVATAAAAIAASVPQVSR